MVVEASAHHLTLIGAVKLILLTIIKDFFIVKWFTFWQISNKQICLTITFLMVIVIIIIMAYKWSVLFACTFASSLVRVVFWLKSLLLFFCSSTVEINTEPCCMSRQSLHSQCSGLLSLPRYREDEAAHNSYRKVDKHTATNQQLFPWRPFVFPLLLSTPVPCQNP